MSVRYLVNVFKKDIFLPDIKKRIPFNPEGYEVYQVDEDTFTDSNDLKDCIKAKMLIDITSQVLEQQKQQKDQEPVIEMDKTTNEERAPQQPQNIQKKSSIMVEDWETSRALSGSDREERLKAVNNGFRNGERSRIIVDDYDSPEQTAKAAKARASFLVDEGSRANPTIDPRFGMQRNDDTSMNFKIDGVPIQINLPSNEPQKKNIVEASFNQEQRPVANNPFWWKNSSIATERMAKQALENAIRKARIKQEDNDPRLEQKSQMMPNPLLAQALSDEDPNEKFYDAMSDKNPLLKDLTASNNKTTKTSKKSSKATSKKAGKLSAGIFAQNQMPSLSIGDILNEPKEEPIKETSRRSSKSAGSKPNRKRK